MQSVWPRWLTRPWPRDLLVLPPLLGLIFLTIFLQETDPDYWWHVRIGQQIAETGALPGGDFYSFTATGVQSFTHEWLIELVLYVVYRQVGYVGNVALFGLFSVLTWLTVYATCRLRGLGEMGAALLMMGAFAIAWGGLDVRPQVLTMLLLAVYAWLLTRYKRGERRALWALPPLMALWVNVHGGWPIGLALLGLTFCGELLAALAGRRAAPIKPLAVVGVLTALATLVNPHGVQLLLFPLNVAGTQNPSMQNVAEWQSPNFHEPYFLLLAAGLLATVLLGLAAPPLGPTEVLWGLCFTLLPLQSVRHVALYAVVVVPLLGARLLAVAPALGRPLAAWRRPMLPLFLWPPLLLCCLVLLLRTDERGARLQVGREPSAAGYPAAAVRYLADHDLAGNVFNEYDWGGFLIYHFDPRRPIFIDGRLDLYQGRVFDAWNAVIHLEPRWRQVLDDYDVQLVLVHPAGPLAVALRDVAGWERLYADDVAAIYRRRAP